MARKPSPAAIAPRGHARLKLDECEGRRKGAQLLDGVELSHQDISLWHSVCFASLHTSRKWELSTATALGTHCHFPTLHINKSKQTTLLHNLRPQMEYDLNIKHCCKYFRGRRRFVWYWNWIFFWKLEQIQFPGFPYIYLYGLGNANSKLFATALNPCIHSKPLSVSHWGQHQI